MRTQLLLATTVLAAVSGAQAPREITGAVPLAWRWQGATTVAPGPLEVEGDRVFAAVGRRIFALDRGTGNQLWRFPAGDPMQNSFNRGVLRVGGLVVAATDARLMVAVDAATGARRWEYTAPVNIAGRPVIVGDGIAFALGDGTLMLIQARDGVPIWQSGLRIPNGFFGQIAGTPQGDILVTDGFFQLVNYGVDQRVRWTQRFNFLSPDVVPVVDGDFVYVATGDFVVTLDRRTGRQRGQGVNAGEPVALYPAVQGETMAIVTRSGMVRTFSSRTGRPSFPAIDMGALAITAPSFVGRSLVINTTSGTMMMVNPLTGEIQWNYTLRPVVRAAPVGGRPSPNFMTAAAPAQVSNGTLMLLGRDGQIQAFDALNGVDLTGPFITMTFPPAGAEIYGRSSVPSGFLQPFFVWELDDPGSGLRNETVQVTINGRKMTHQWSRTGALVVQINGTGANQSLSDGPANLVVTAKDWLGNEARFTASVFVDNNATPFRSGPADPGGGFGGGPGRGD